MSEISLAVALLLGLTLAHADEQPRRPTAAELQVQLLESDLRNYRAAAAQLSEANQKLTDELEALKKKCSEK